MPNDNQPTDLLPCPFCGGSNLTERMLWCEGDPCGEVVRCDDCKIQGPEWDRWDGGKEAANLWNTRAQTAAAKGVVEDLVGALDCIGLYVFSLHDDTIESETKIGKSMRKSAAALERARQFTGKGK